MLSLPPPPKFWVRDVPVYGDVILSPMAGFSDVPYRAICRAYGSAMNYTEFVPVEALLGKPNRFWQRLDVKQYEEFPMVFQIFGNDPQLILAAAQRIEELGPDIIDINMGCSTRRVSGRGAGVGLMRTPHLIAETFRLLTHHLSVPVTGKIRLGWDDHINFIEVGRILEDNGAALVALHGRTKEQKYSGRASWDAIAELKASMSIPVIGNGDVTTPEDINNVLSYTNCDAVMIGRGAIGNPWIFSRKRRSSLTFAEVAAAIRLHADEMVAYYGNSSGLILFRKHLKRYMGDFEPLADYLTQLLTTEDVSRFHFLLAEAEGQYAYEYMPDMPVDLETESCETA